MLIGYPPFKFDKNNFNINIFNKEIFYPNSFTEEAKLFLKDILIVDPNKRLGSGKNGVENIKKHPFFNGINWEDLENKKSTRTHKIREKITRNNKLQLHSKFLLCLPR